jgi:LacI family transcriptional regulator
LNHLLRIGRKRILLICGEEGHYFSNDLLRAYWETLAEHHMEIDPRLVVYADFHVKGGFKATQQVLEAGVPFDAIFSNDEMACGAIKALKQASRKVPEDVSVVGFDGLPIGEVVSPTLTTVAVDREKMGKLAVKRLLQFERETGEEEKFEKISIFPSLLVRESCGGRPEKATE